MQALHSLLHHPTALTIPTDSYKLITQPRIPTYICHHTANQQHEINMPTLQYDCCFCLKTKEEQFDQVQSLAGDVLCSECAPTVFSKLFEAALQHEINYPPTWGSAVLNFDDFQHLFTPELARAWRARIRESETPVRHRVYCQQKPLVDISKAGPNDANFCNHFIGETAIEGVAQCRSCGSWTCLNCRCLLESPMQDHDCIKPEDDESIASLDDAAGQGEEWQQCPNPACSVKCTLGDGCNSITCHFCSTQFCNLCGKETSPDGNHWTQQRGCPRWGGYDAANPMFDVPLDESFAAGIEAMEMIAGLAVVDRTAARFPDNPSLKDGDQALFDKLNTIILWEEFDFEIRTAAGKSGTVPKLLADMKTLLYELAFNLEWVSCEWALRDPVFRATSSDPVLEAVEAVNFIILHERLAARFVETLDAVLASAAPSPVLILNELVIRGMFARYMDEHQPMVAESMRRFVSRTEIGRTLWVQEEDRVDRRA